MTTQDHIKQVRRKWQGNLNKIPLAIAYDFELRLIIDNNPADGFRGSPARIEAAKRELTRRMGYDPTHQERCPVCGGLNPGDITHTRC